MVVLKRSSILLAALGLAACGGTSGNDVMQFSADDELRRSFAENVGDVGAALEDGATLSSRAESATGIQLRFGGGETTLADVDVEVTKNEDGELTATLNGQSRAFTAADRKVEDDGNSYGYEFEAEDGSTFSLFHFGGSLEELLTEGNGYGTVVSVAGDLGPEGDTLYHRSFAAIGGETTDVALAEVSGTTEFEGFGRFDLYPAEDFINSGTSRNRLRGNVEMTVAFGDGEISGFMNNLTLQSAGSSERDAIAGQVDFNETTFDANTFAGSVSGDAALAEAGLVINGDAAYNGAFFGPEAEEVHGVVNGTGALDGTDMNILGYFSQ